MVKAIRYTPALRMDWDAFVMKAVNATLLHRRSYMDYHADRFEDVSLMFCDDHSQIVALLPACFHREDRGVIVSHQGLTYGGFIVGEASYAYQMEEIFDAALAYYRDEVGARELVITPAPQIYSSIPTEEQLYFILRRGGCLTARHLSQSLRTDCHPPMSQLRRRCVGKAKRMGVTVDYAVQRGEWDAFHCILREVLAQRHSTTPVHTADELWQLYQDNKEQIRLVVAREGDVIVAGVVLYLSATVAHTQYLASAERGQQVGALDMIVDYLIGSIRLPYLDFGVSTERDGSLNYGLAHQKEGFGARGICYDTYSIKL